MNRSTFFKTLGIGIASAPTLAKVLAEEPSPFKFRKVSEWRPAPPGYRPNPAWDDAPYRIHFVRPSHPFRGTPIDLMQRMVEDARIT